MKKNFKVLLLAVFVAAASCSFTTKSFDNPEKDKLLIDLVTYVLEKWHYDAPPIDDVFSKAVYTNFIDGVDPIKRYFLAQDIQEFEQYKLQIDDQLKMKDLSFFNLVYDRLVLRMEESKKIYQNALNTPFDYTKDETINVDYDASSYANNKKELQARWRKQLKFSTISTYYDFLEEKQTVEKRKAEALKQSKKYIATVNEDLTDTQLEEKSRASTQTSLEEYYDFTDDLQRKDYFAIFLTTIVEQFDPHTNYMAPPDRDRFDQRMSGKLEGVGARLQKKKDYINVIEVISGGPAWRGEHVEVGDVLLKVRQEDELEPVSIVGMRIDDAIKLIKGPKGTVVELTVRRKVDNEIKTFPITRDEVVLEESYAKSTLIKKDNKTYGLITLPKFYVDFNDYKEINCASDVKKEIINLKKEGIEGLVLDLRNNGGGALQTVVDMTGLFIETGPIVQVKSIGNRKKVLYDKDPSVFWDGPLVILVNQMSASASEIMAAALQDYERAVVIGSDNTFGKGTVQNVLDLNRFLSNSDFDLGALKITTEKFYRINGGSVQLKGVESDIVTPNTYSHIEIGEADEKNPLKWDQIDGYYNLESVINDSKLRISKNELFSLIDQNAKWFSERRKNKSYSLNYNTFKNDQKNNKLKLKKFDRIKDYNNNLNFNLLSDQSSKIKDTEEYKENRKRWHNSLKSDIYINESINVL